MQQSLLPALVYGKGRPVKSNPRAIFRPLLALVLAVGSYIVPKKDCVAFLPGQAKNKFAGNLKALFLYTHAHPSGANVVWLTGSAKTANALKARKLPVVKFVLFPLWELLRAKTIVIDTTQFSLAFGRFSIVQLWHGTGFKTIGATSFRGPVQAILGRRHYAKYQLIASTSPDDMERKKKSFGSPSVFITGSPRNDIFFSSGFDRDLFKEELGLSSFESVYLYAPTFRDSGEFEPFSSEAWSRVSELMTRKNSVFVVKKHPGDRQLKIPENLKNVLDLTAEVNDVQELLAATDVLITDYSGIVTDYVLSGKPVVFYTFDYESYNRIRPMYYDFRKTVPGPFANDENQLLELLGEQTWFADDGYQEKYRAFVDRYHTYQDGQSCLRIATKLGLIT
jgi:CDP-glycerol glycerophosphotransferase (TagB/SpsB family)